MRDTMVFILVHAIILALLLPSSSSFGSFSWEESNQRCVPNEVTMCKNSGWSHMWLPNHLKHTTKDEVEMEIDQWKQLVDYNCHTHLKLFLCSMYAPVCPKAATEEDREKVKIFPCRSLCQSVREKCEPVMNKYKFQWPDNIFNCSTFPDESTNLCISSELVSKNSTRPMNITPPPKPVKVVPYVSPCNSEVGCACEVVESKAAIKKAYCESDFAIRARVSERKQTGTNLMLKVRPNKVLKGKKGKKERSDIRVYIVGGGSDHCKCDKIKSKSRRQWLVMGKKVGKPNCVTYITHKKKLIKRIAAKRPNCS